MILCAARLPEIRDQDPMRQSEARAAGCMGECPAPVGQVVPGDGGDDDIAEPGGRGRPPRELRSPASTGAGVPGG